MVKNDMMTCFFYAPYKSTAANLWLSEVYLAFQNGTKNYIYSIFRSGIHFRQDIFLRYPEVDEYLTITAAWDTVVYRRLARRAKIIMIWNPEAFDKLLLEVKQNLVEFKKRFLEELDNPKYQMTKLRRYQRDFIWPEDKVFIGPDNSSRPLIRGTVLSAKYRQSSMLWIALIITQLILLHVSSFLDSFAT